MYEWAEILEGFKGPENDTRQWSSWGLVNEGKPGKPAIYWTDKDGKPLQEGYLLVVTLQPSGIILPCRVLGAVAGNGEADYYPWAAGDEVYVEIPEGNERAGGVVVGRGNQVHDKFPTTVAGQDVTQNMFGFRRMRAPYIIETSSSYIIRSAVTGAFVGIDRSGSVSIAGGDGGSLHVGPDFIGLQTVDSSASVQLVPAPSDKSHGNQVQINADACTFLLDGDQSLFLTKGTLGIGAAGNTPAGHAMTVEQFLTFMQGFIIPPAGGLAGPTMIAAIAAALGVGMVAVLDTAVIIPALTAALQTPPVPGSNKFGIACPGITMG